MNMCSLANILQLDPTSKRFQNLPKRYYQVGTVPPIQEPLGGTHFIQTSAKREQPCQADRTSQGSPALPAVRSTTPYSPVSVFFFLHQIPYWRQPKKRWIYSSSQHKVHHGGRRVRQLVTWHPHSGGRDGWCPAPFLLFIQSRKPAHETMSPTFTGSLPISVNQTGPEACSQGESKSHQVAHPEM